MFSSERLANCESPQLSANSNSSRPTAVALMAEVAMLADPSTLGACWLDAWANVVDIRLM